MYEKKKHEKNRETNSFRFDDFLLDTKFLLFTTLA